MIKVRRMLKNQRGQGLVEYALILVLIAIVVAVAVAGLGTKTSQVFSAVDTKMPSPQ